MKQLGNLAIVCARRQSVQLHIEEGVVSVSVGTGLGQDVLSAHWDNDAEIERIIYELNFGKYCAAGEVCSSENRDFKDADVLWNLLLRHRGHNVVIVTYGDPDAPVDVCLECEDCGEVVLDAELNTLAAKE